VGIEPVATYAFHASRGGQPFFARSLLAEGDVN
jgi:hypothetical protein